MQSKIEIKIFIVIIFLLLICPLFRIDNDEFLFSENRALAVLHPLFNTKDKTFNSRFSIEFNSWLEDRFWGRKQLMNLNRYIKYYIGGHFVRSNIKSSKSIDDLMIDKKSKFLYRHVYNESFDNDTINEINSQLNKFSEYCESRNIKLFLVLLPLNKILYPPDFTQYGYRKRFDETILKIGGNNFTVVRPTENLLKAKEKSPYLLFYKPDPHFTMDGTYISYRLLMEAMKNKYPNLKISKEDDFDYIVTKNVDYLGIPNDEVFMPCEFISIPDAACGEYYDTYYRYYVHKDNKSLNIVYSDKDKDIEVFNYPKGYNLRVMIFGDSFVASLKQIIPYSFRDTAIIRPVRFSDFKLIKYYEDEINEFHPDVLVIYLNYFTMGKLVNLMSR